MKEAAKLQSRPSFSHAKLFIVKLFLVEAFGHLYGADDDNANGTGPILIALKIKLKSKS
jgi:hypothetical protein